jgi:uncharacterized protein YodC (DUF2158 family)
MHNCDAQSQHTVHLKDSGAMADASAVSKQVVTLCRWVQGKTMREAGFVLKQLEDYARKHPKRLMRLAAAPEDAVAAAERHARQPA